MARQSRSEASEGIDAISSSTRKPLNWSNVSSDVSDVSSEIYSHQEMARREEKKIKASSVDTLAPALSPPAILADPVPKEALKSVESSSNSSVLNSLLNKFWDFISTPIAIHEMSPESKANYHKAKYGNKPLLDTPFHMDMKAYRKLMAELQEMADQINKINNDADENLQDSERLVQNMQLLITYMKRQKQIREEAVTNRNQDLVFLRNQEKSVRQEQSDAEKARIETNKDRQFWTAVNSKLTVATVVLLGISAISTGVNWATSAPLAAFQTFQMISQVSTMVMGTATGCSGLMKAHFDRLTGEFKEQSVNLRDQHHITNVKIKYEFDQMMASYDSSLKINEWLGQLLKNQQETAQSINSR